MSTAPPPSSRPVQGSAPYPAQPGYRPRTGRTVAIVLGLMGLVALVFFGFMLWVFSVVRNSSATESAVAVASRDARVVAVTGLPLKTGWFVSGHVNGQGDGGEATLTIPVSGPLGRGNVYVIERNGFAGWQPTTLEFWPAKNPNDIVRIVEPGSGGEPR